MRALIQRVSEASVTVNGAVIGQIGKGLLILLGIRGTDTDQEAISLAQKVVRLRIFPDNLGKMNLSLLDVAGELLIVSQFTLYGDTSRGNRPSFTEAANPQLAEPLYEKFIENCRTMSARVCTGVFQADMQVRLVNDGPVTLLCSLERD